MTEGRASAVTDKVVREDVSTWVIFENRCKWDQEIREISGVRAFQRKEDPEARAHFLI